jgi:uncharacterized membrane protein YfcA
MSYFIFLFFTGLAGGFLGGLLGIGGGLLFIVILPIALQQVGVPEAELAQYIIANSLFATFFSSLTANYIYIKRKTFHLREVMIIGVFSIITSVVMLKTVVNTSWYSKDVFDNIIIILLMYLLLRTFLNARKAVVEDKDTRKSTVLLSLVGLAGGTVAPLSGLGGGIVLIPILNSFLKYDVKKANAISLGVIGVTSSFITIFNLIETPKYDYDYYNAGYIVFPIAIALSLGVIIGSPYGISTSRKVSSQAISYVFSCLLVLIIIRKVMEANNLVF